MSPPSGLAVDVLGADGSVWPLLDPLAPVRLGTGLSGLFSARGELQWGKSSVGRRRRGRTVDGRSLSMKVIVGDALAPWRRGEDWRRLDAAWWDALGGGDDSFTVSVRTTATDLLGRPSVRSLQLWDASLDEGISNDPARDGRATYTVTAEAEAAYLSGPEVAAEFVYNPSVDVDYYGAGAGLGPPFYIGGGSQFRNATITNPGQLPAWPRWTIKAPFSSASVGIGDQLVTLPFTQVFTQQVVIDSDPRRRSITDGAGTNLWPLVGPGLDPLFAPVPPRTSVPLAITLEAPAAGSAVLVSLTPEFRRAW